MDGSIPPARSNQMPGLVAIIDPHKRKENTSLIIAMLAEMPQEAFYTTGVYGSDDIGLYVGWSVHTGSYSDCMPVQSKDGNLVLFFYGEHRNGNSGEIPNPTNATEVLRLIEQSGVGALPKLNGWFHGIWADRANSCVYVFNDRFGMQRLHVAKDDERTLLASSAAPILKLFPRFRMLDASSVADYLTCGCVLENRSMFRSVSTLPRATLQKYRDGKLSHESTHFHPSQWETQPPLAPDAFLHEVHDAFQTAVRRCLNSDQSVSLSLTGGFDTRLIAATLPRESTMPCYTFGGMYRECFDVAIAKRVAATRKWPHKTYSLNGTFLSDFATLAEQTIRLSDAALGATNAYELYLNRLARASNSVRLTGSYGSEVMRGVRAFKATPPITPLVTFDMLPHISRSVGLFAQSLDGHPISFSVFKQAPWYYYNRLAIEQSQVTIRTPYMDNDFVGVCYRRPPELSDSRRLARDLIAESDKQLAAFPTDTGNCSHLRHLWYQFLFNADYCYKSGMPQWLEYAHYVSRPLNPEKLLIGRHRFAHFRVWFRNELASYLREILLDPRCASRPYFSHSFVERMVIDHTRGIRNYTEELEKVLTIELASRIFTDN